MKNVFLRGSAALLGVMLASSGPLWATPRATFSGAGSVDDPRVEQADDFPGAIGDGWSGPWKILLQKKGDAAISAKIADEKSLSSEGGKRLEISYEREGGDAGNRAGVARQFSNDPESGGIDLLKPYRVKFQFRLDAAEGGFNEMQDRMIFAGSSEVSRRGPGEKDQWAVIYRGARKPGEAVGEWAAWQQNEKGEADHVHFGGDNGTVEVGAVYDVTIFVDPIAKTWDVEVSKDGVGFRASEANAGTLLALAPSPVGSTFLSFRSSRVGRGKTMAWSLDNVEVVQDK